jgi:hypothetical protein
MADARDEGLPYPLEVAMVEAAGSLFWYWNAFRECVCRAGVRPAAFDKYRAEEISKYGVMRRVLSALHRSNHEGAGRVQRNLVRYFIDLPVRPSDDVDVEQAKRTQAHLRELAEELQLFAEPTPAVDGSAAAKELAEVAERQARSRARQRVRAANEATRAALFAEFTDLLSQSDAQQARGYRLEEMLGELATLDGLMYKPPYRKSTVSQTDGMVTFDGFQYLIEARWRAAQADVNAIGALVAKVSRNLDSTRGLFVSMAGFRDEVVREIENGSKNVLLMAGNEFAHVLEGRKTLEEALRLKVEEAAARGRIYFDITAT